MNLAIALTAARQGATVCNHVEVLELLKKKDDTGKEKLFGAKVKDTITGKTWEVKAKCIINATGPFTDHVNICLAFNLTVNKNAIRFFPDSKNG